MSLLDGYSGYNQILVHEDDQEKTTFTTPWGKFKYAKMPFGLKNAGATFQRAMDIGFGNENMSSWQFIQMILLFIQIQMNSTYII